jgi:SAM-dependent methyltransferase
VAPPFVRSAARAGRRLLYQLAERSHRTRRALTRAEAELHLALETTTPPADGFYGGAYFGAGRDALDRMGLSGYERYDRQTSNADVAAYLVWKHFGMQRTLDVGCAMGFVVEALRELGMQASGVDVSRYAVAHAAPGARGHLHHGDLLEGLPFFDGAFELVTALETLEHLQPERIAQALAELRRVCRGYVVATIPSFGSNVPGPDGWYDVKVRPERLDYYRSLGAAFEGPVPYVDLYRDVAGNPIEGHLTIASFTWWTRQFEAAGFRRCAELERRLLVDIERFGLLIYWNLYVLRLPEAPVPPADVRGPGAVADLERRWGLDRRAAAAADRAEADQHQ